MNSVDDNSPRVQRALISVSDKSGLVPLAQRLAAMNIEIYSTGGTRRHLMESGLQVHDISEYTQFPEMMDGRLKTLHPKVFGGILARHDRDDDLSGLQEHGINTFELVVVNLYPFQQTIEREGVTDAEAIEQIDIGGPSLVRAAAKNHKFITIATDPSQYDLIGTEIEAKGSTTIATRRSLAAAAFARTADYDCAIAKYFVDSDSDTADWPCTIHSNWNLVTTLRYGENPHQAAALYADPNQQPPNVLSANQLNGKELSYNNYLDLDAALSMVRGFEQPAVSVIKHNNPCGIACGTSISEAATKAMAGDPTSAFGSILGCNRPIDAAMAEVLSAPGLFIEAIIGPEFSPEALDILTTRPKWKKNVRLMHLGADVQPTPGRAIRPIDGGILVQDSDSETDPQSDWKVATTTNPSDEQLRELRFAWEVVRHVKSNAIVLTRDQSLVGNGAGQMSRVDAVEIAIRKAGDRTQGSVLASDAFFPFPDSIHHAAEAGIVAVIQPGGSKNDELVINACNEHGIAMIMTGRRHFRH